MNEKQIEYNKILSKNRRDAIVKRCLWGGDEGSECSTNIVDAHSIQRGKILSSIADAGKIYHLGLVPSENMKEMVPFFKLEGIKKFSTFSGFCGYHDKIIFQPIEDKAYVGSCSQINIYAYRAVSKELHSNLESLNLIKNQLGNEVSEGVLPAHYRVMLPKIINNEIELPQFLKEHILSMARNEFLRQRLNDVKLNISELMRRNLHLKEVILGETECALDSITFSLDGEYPIACCADFIPYFNHNGEQIISEEDIVNMSKSEGFDIVNLKNSSLNIFPESGKTHVLFTFHKGNVAFRESLKKMESEKDDEIKIALSNFILNYTENVAFNPGYIECNFNAMEKELITLTYANNIINTRLFSTPNVNLFRDGCEY